jgi:hypothetical protein
MLMSVRMGSIARLVIAAVLVAGAGITLGRISVDTHATRERGYQSGLYDGYFKGLPVGEAQGRREGRTLQEGISLPASDRQAAKDAFNAGYAAGANDAFAGYDGGWELSAPYVVTLEQGDSDITYRIASRAPMEPGVAYFLCPTGHGLCQHPRR